MERFGSSALRQRAADEGAGGESRAVAGLGRFRTHPDRVLIITNVPSELGTVLALAAGDAHTLALQTDGTVRAWGIQ
jgi:alpha-tubulin suppressor-like RCC1 family protein